MASDTSAVDAAERRVSAPDDGDLPSVSVLKRTAEPNVGRFSEDVNGGRSGASAGQDTMEADIFAVQQSNNSSATNGVYLVVSAIGPDSSPDISSDPVGVVRADPSQRYIPTELTEMSML